MSTATDVADVQGRLRTALSEIDSALVGRAQEIHLAFVAAVAGESLLLVGAPGAAKSLVVDSVARLVSGRPAFKKLMGKYTTPDEVFGPPDVVAMERGEYRRVVEGTLVDARVAFLDEIWKASSAINNMLLDVLNERTFQNGRESLKVPLRFFMAASNEYPNSENGGQELKALFDRFVIRTEVEYVQEAREERALFWGRGAAAGADGLLRRAGSFVPRLSVAVTPEELDAVKLAAVGDPDDRDAHPGLPFTRKAVEAFEGIVHALKAEGVVVSDRRKVKAPGVAQAAAFLAGSDRVEPEHLEVLAHVLWDEPVEQRAKAAMVVARHAAPDATEAVKLMGEVDAVRRGLAGAGPVMLAEGLEKVKDVLTRLERLKPGARVAQALSRARALNDEILDQLGRRYR